MHFYAVEGGKGGAMTFVAGVDGTPGGWAVVTMAAAPSNSYKSRIQKVGKLTDLLDGETNNLNLVAIDVPIGLLDAYEIGGRACDREARQYVRQRRGSVFPAPVRAVLDATSYPEACRLSRESSSLFKAVSLQTYNIRDKIKEVDELLLSRPSLRHVVREVHPEVCFCELSSGQPMAHKKRSPAGRDERRSALKKSFLEFDEIERSGREQGLPIEDILDATVACWSALRLLDNNGRSLPDPVPFDKNGLPMAIWV